MLQLTLGSASNSAPKSTGLNTRPKKPSIYGKTLLIVAALLISAAVSASPTGGSGTSKGSGDELSSLSMSDMVKGAAGLVRQMEDQLSESFQLLEASIAAGDVPATNARNEAITAMKGLVKLSEQNLMTLQQKAAEQDRQRVEHEYVKITIAHAKVGEFYAQVKSATGAPLDLELTDVERVLLFQGSLPVVENVTASFGVPIFTTPDPPVHASPYF